MKTNSVRILFCFAVLLAVALLGCGNDSGDDGIPSSNGDGGATEFDVAKSEKQRITTPDATASELGELVAGNSAFAFEMYQAIRYRDENLIYSPFSMSLALAMTYAGARTETEQQMGDTMNYTLSQERLHPAFNALDLELISRGEGNEAKDEEGFRLNIANSIWGQTGYSFLEDFLDVLAENYGAGLRLLDFISAPEESRVTINDWVSEQTEGKIEDLIPQGAICSDTRLVLTNAIYFNAAWEYPFKEELTDQGAFHLLDGGEVTVDMMHLTEMFKYAAGDGYQAVDLFYDGLELSMVILIPDEGRFEEFESALTYENVEAILAELSFENVDLSMPKFTFEFELNLNDALIGMGMSAAFDPMVADFSGMDGTRNLVITEILHKAFIGVDEAGTEAAAATAVIIGESSIPEGPVDVTINRPFIFFIRDIETGSVLFVGRVLDPTA
jgi:serpin B